MKGNVPAGEIARPAAGAAPPQPRLFRRVDWLAFLLTFALVWIGYYLTLAPEVTLEDSGELATGSFYAGIPHSPGYPVWTIYTWLWTVLVPFGNVAWRVALAEATSGAVAAGLLGMLVSRGSGLLLAGIAELKALPTRSERAICLVSGFVAGMLLGFNGFMWSQSVIVEVYSFSVASFMVVLLFLLRWIYEPRHWRYLCFALFFHGLCFTNHQTLIVAAIGIEVAIAAANFKLGRELWLGNSIIFLCGLVLSAEKILTTLESNHAVLVIYYVVGIGSVLAYVWFSVLTRPKLNELARQWVEAAFLIGVVSAPVLNARLGGFATGVILVACLAAFLYLAQRTWSLGWEWLLVIILGLCWIGGAAFYFYMPLAGMTNPPMEWSYPRTVQGFIHAFTRGQYEKTIPSDIIHHPDVFLTQLGMLGRGIIDEFNWVYAFLALVPFVFFFKLHRRERTWLIGVTAIYLCLGVLLLILLNPPPDRASQELVRVFFTASHTLVALMVGYGLALIAASMAAQYGRFRMVGLLGGAVAVGLALLSFTELTHDTYFGATAAMPQGRLFWLIGQAFTNPDQYGLPIFAGLLLLAMCVVFLLAVGSRHHRAPLGITLALFVLMPVHSILTHWSDNEERNHWFGYWFGHDMFSPPLAAPDGKPLYPPMARNAVLFGGTDPGRFCPTYMIFCDSFLPARCRPAPDPAFDRRDVYLITQNALADGTYLEYIRAQYFRSAQIDEPFFQELFRLLLHDGPYQTNALARAMKPVDAFFTEYGAKVENRRRTFTSWFKDGDFTPAFANAVFTGVHPEPGTNTTPAVTGGHVPSPLYHFILDSLSAKTRNELQTPAEHRSWRADLTADLNRLLERELKTHRDPLYTPERFAGVELSDYLRQFLKQDPQGATRVRLNRLLLEAAYPELPRSLGGVYPDREIYTPSPEDLARSLDEYIADAARRLQHNQLHPGEQVSMDPSGRVQISGQVAVMAINALLTKIIFDHNPGNEFYVEESLPLDWMFPYLSPFGIIMKVNRQPIKELTPDIVDADHRFWTQYSRRFIGDWVTYDTSLKQIATWAEKTYLLRDFSGFTGDRKFIRDDQAQKSFSKLRSSIAGIYAWRVQNTKAGTPEHARALKEADFAFRQAFALCPYNTDAISRYINLLVSPELQRFDDALILAHTLLLLDPYNSFASGLVVQLNQWKKEQGLLNPAVLNKQLESHPNDFQLAFNLASTYLQAGKTDLARQTLDEILNNTNADMRVYRTLLQAYHSLHDNAKLQVTADKLSAEFRAEPTNIEAAIGVAEAYQDLGRPELEIQALDQVFSRSNLSPNVLLVMAQHFAQVNNLPRLEAALERLVAAAPQSAESWYNLAALKAALGKTSQAIDALRHCFAVTRQDLQHDPKATDFITQARTDPRFEALRQNPEFKALFQ
jgi:thioredoxin-like negative regulator of GroEL